MLRYLAHPYELLGVAVAVVLCLYGHNIAQALTARLLGDSTSSRQGFTSLRPGTHLSPYGTVAVALAFFGWGFAATVPMETRFVRRRQRTAAALLAGPLAIFVVLLAAALVYRVASPQGHLHQAAFFAVLSAAGLCIVSLLPFPPLALGRVLSLYAPTTAGWQRARYQLEQTQVGSLIALAVLLLPVLLPGLPDVVGQLSAPLVRGVGHLLAITDLQTLP